MGTSTCFLGFHRKGLSNFPFSTSALSWSFGIFLGLRCLTFFFNRKTALPFHSKRRLRGAVLTWDPVVLFNFKFHFLSHLDIILFRIVLVDDVSFLCCLLDKFTYQRKIQGCHHLEKIFSCWESPLFIIREVLGQVSVILYLNAKSNSSLTSPQTDFTES